MTNPPKPKKNPAELFNEFDLENKNRDWLKEFAELEQYLEAGAKQIVDSTEYEPPAIAYKSNPLPEGYFSAVLNKWYGKKDST